MRVIHCPYFTVAMGGYSLVPAMNNINFGGGWGATMLPPGADLSSVTSQLQYAGATPISFSEYMVERDACDIVVHVYTNC